MERAKRKRRCGRVKREFQGQIIEKSLFRGKLQRDSNWERFGGSVTCFHYFNWNVVKLGVKLKFRKGKI